MKEIPKKPAHEIMSFMAGLYLANGKSGRVELMLMELVGELVSKFVDSTTPARQN